ncbi:LEAF RUST 10 DISEASE-RESISTANCE LOCUS RECEPTOR-LIKE PROTEIN KINASE-like 1.2 isoform X1 [Andrographis paniculata]|uniref:LEAF RUST 10 DISEASE-RESISTANCE LOCUS RECEPTOR-LIKE PROTEIN KINASE-like 1.2 isoform X1 n=1 Tax=Andrographis paniculata TaxID=175694 RepID=UPI0021E9469C|nr:LEAF RUST 10 DISEASE-RESISTANCE LOCUS RECEPTOR-LIKE PROTEIN KINASE-like 1.2 isoform X1 [Andrographis paniculata]
MYPFRCVCHSPPNPIPTEASQEKTINGEFRQNSTKSSTIFHDHLSFLRNPLNEKMNILKILLVLGIPAVCFCQEDQLYETCRQPLHCGAMENISYPFWGGDRPENCGRRDFKLTCEDDVLRINISSVTYRVLDHNPSAKTLSLARDDLWDSPCPSLFLNNSLNPSLFEFSSSFDAENVSLYYHCTVGSPTSPPNPFLNRFLCWGTWSFYQYPITDVSGLGSGIQCGHRITVWVNQSVASSLEIPKSSSVDLLRNALKDGFWIHWTVDDLGGCDRCLQSGGACGQIPTSGKFACHCRDGPHDSTCNDGKEKSKNTGMIIGLPIAGAVLAGAVFGWLIFYYKQRRKDRKQPLAAQAVAKDITTPHPSSTPLSTPNSSNFTRSIPSYPSSNSDLDRGSSSYFGVQVFSYAELEQATDNFNSSRELGDGGFGVVYYGELPDGRTVAVKRLYENNYRRLEQFMNEVEILTQLRHPNLVALYGCTSKRSRELLLVYEYIPNGTVSDHLHGSHTKSSRLSWPVRLSIAVETAEALGYLHRSKIIHRDVKTNNILLDNNLHVKVADFGLSRLFPTGVTHVSTAPQGTPGYVDPEYYQCYHLTEKSDVYSFGVVLIELISSLMAVDTSRHRHDINLANMAVNKIQNHALQEMVDPSLGFKTNPIVRRKITLVAELAFQCLQPDRDMRPSMDEVLDALKGIHSDDMNANKAEAVEILVDSDETGPLRGSAAPSSPPEA